MTSGTRSIKSSDSESPKIKKRKPKPKKPTFADWVTEAKDKIKAEKIKKKAQFEKLGNSMRSVHSIDAEEQGSKRDAEEEDPDAPKTGIHLIEEELNSLVEAKYQSLQNDVQEYLEEDKKAFHMNAKSI